MGVVRSMEVSKAGGLVVLLAARVGQWWQEGSRNCPSMRSEAATGNPSIFGKRSQIPLLLLTSTHEHCRPAMTNVQAFPLPTGQLPDPHPTHSPPAHPLLASARTPARGWPGRAWPGCGPASLACCPGSGSCQVSDSISRPSCSEN